nr:MAG TPA: hypothetical protein [Caudoviricetes sp.]
MFRLQSLALHLLRAFIICNKQYLVNSLCIICCPPLLSVASALFDAPLGISLFLKSSKFTSWLIQPFIVL